MNRRRPDEDLEAVMRDAEGKDGTSVLIELACQFGQTEFPVCDCLDKMVDECGILFVSNVQKSPAQWCGCLSI